MNTPELANVLLGLTGEIAHLSTEVSRLAAGQASPTARADLKTGTVEVDSEQSTHERDGEPKSTAHVETPCARPSDDRRGTRPGPTSSAIEDRMRTVQLIVDGQSNLMIEMARIRYERWARFRELRELILFVHKDLCERIDARIHGTNRPG